MLENIKTREELEEVLFSEELSDEEYYELHELIEFAACVERFIEGSFSFDKLLKEFLEHKKDLDFGRDALMREWEEEDFADLYKILLLYGVDVNDIAKLLARTRRRYLFCKYIEPLIKMGLDEDNVKKAKQSNHRYIREQAMCEFGTEEVLKYFDVLTEDFSPKELASLVFSNENDYLYDRNGIDYGRCADIMKENESLRDKLLKMSREANCEDKFLEFDFALFKETYWYVFWPLKPGFYGSDEETKVYSYCMDLKEKGFDPQKTIGYLIEHAGRLLKSFLGCCKGLKEYGFLD